VVLVVGATGLVGGAVCQKPDRKRSARWRSWPGSKKSAASGFRVERVPEAALRAQFDQATDSLQESFAALMLAYAAGDAMDMAPVVKKFGMRLTSIEEYARAVTASV
jgi:hypothetical protein